MAIPVAPPLMPVPAAFQPEAGQLKLDGTFQVVVCGALDDRLSGALSRALRRLEERTGLGFFRTPTGEYVPAGKYESAALVIDCTSLSATIPQLREDESYALSISATQAELRAPTTLGVLRGLETMLQLVQSDAGGWFLPAVHIMDHPRFPWRGLMIDVCRHWQPMEVIKRNLDGMALVKLNVLHLHLTDDQGFRIESKKFPRLHELGSDGHYFTQEQMREIIAYAVARGIRVVPEFDLPGHATSWLVGYPTLASARSPHGIERKWGVFDPVLDPTNEEVYTVLDGFLGEMAALFPDHFIHIGGDENNGVQWTANLAIQEFIRSHQLKDNAGLHAHFNTRVHAILAKYGKQLMGWDEILHPNLPAGSVVHSWRGPDGIAAATQLGHPVVLSNGYYIDLCYSTATHYLNDPAPAGAKLNDAQRQLVLGGEATMWSEWVSPATIDSRIWPRTAAIAERLWSPAEICDLPDMYRRLELVSRRLEEAGLRHESYLDPALRALAGDAATVSDLQALRRFVDLLEPVKRYARGGYQPDATQFTPLNGLVDCVRPDSAAARRFVGTVDEFITTPQSSQAGARLAEMLITWHDTAAQLLNRLPALSPRLSEAESVLRDIADATKAGTMAQQALQEARVVEPAIRRDMLEAVRRVAKPRAAVEFPANAALEKLIATATGAAFPPVPSL